MWRWRSAPRTPASRPYGSSARLVEHPVPARPREEMGEHRDQALHRRAGALILVILAFGLVRPVDHERLALDVFARQEPPVAAVLRIVAVVAHHEIVVGRHRHRT